MFSQHSLCLFVAHYVILRLDLCDCLYQSLKAVTGCVQVALLMTDRMDHGTGVNPILFANLLHAKVTTATVKQCVNTCFFPPIALHRYNCNSKVHLDLSMCAISFAKQIFVC